MDSTESPGFSASLSRGRIFWEAVYKFTPRGCLLLISFLYFALLLVSRRPGCILLPQFWAEEGQQFFANAWEHPALVSLASYSIGYFYLSIRLAAQLAVLFPL